MRAMRSTEIVVTNVPLEKKNLGGKSLPHTNLVFQRELFTREITYNNFEISPVVFMSNTT